MVEWKKLGEVCEFLKGRSLSKDNIGLGKSQIILYGELYTTYGDYITSIKSKTSFEIAAEATKLEFDDLILPVSSTTKEAQIGKASVIKAKTDISLGSDAIILRNSFNPNFLMYYLNSTIFEREKMSCVHGTTIMHLSPKEMAQKLVPIPSVAEQQHIVDILDTFTSSIDNLQQQIAQRQKQYEYYRDQLLDLEGKEGVEMKTLGEVCEIKGRIGFRGYTREDQVTKDEGALSLTATNIINQRIDYKNNTYITWEKYYESPEIMVKNGDIIVCQRGSIGKIAYVENLTDKATINPQLLLIKNIRIRNRFLSYYLLSRFFQNDLSQIIGHGTVQMIAQKDFKNLVVPVPPLSEQERIVDILDQFEASIQNLEAQLSLREKQYEYYRNKLLTFD